MDTETLRQRLNSQVQEAQKKQLESQVQNAQQADTSGIIDIESATNTPTLKMPKPQRVGAVPSIDLSAYFAPSQAEQDQSVVRSNIEDITRQIGQRSAIEQQIGQNLGIDEKSQALQTAENRLAQLSAQQQQVPLVVQEEAAGRGQTRFTTNVREFDANRAIAIQQIGAAADYEAARGNLEVARDLQTQQVNAIFEPLEAELLAQQTFYNMNKDVIDRIDAKKSQALQIQLNERERLLQNEKEQQNFINDLSLNAIDSGYSASDVNDIRSSTSYAEAITKMAAYAPSPTLSFLDYTPEQAYANLTGEQLDNWTAYNELKTQTSEENAKAVIDTDRSIIDTKDMVSNIDDMIANQAGINASGGRSQRSSGDIGLLSIRNKEKVGAFQVDLVKIVSSQALEGLANAKDDGITFGALSDGERKMVADSVSFFGLLSDENGNFDGTTRLGEKELKKRLKMYKNIVYKKGIIDVLGAEKGVQVIKNSGIMDMETEDEKEQFLKSIYDMSVNAYNRERDSFSQPGTGDNSAINLIVEEEGFRPNAYQDQTGTWTIGYGTTQINGQPVQPGQTITESQARDIAEAQIANNYSSFKDKINVPLNENQIAALTSFEYNLGSDIWNKDAKSIINNINAGNFDKAAQDMNKFVYSKGQKLPGLVSRRQKESNLLLT